MAVACFLYNRDISSFNPLNRPKTRASQLAKERGLNSLERFVVGTLEAGKTPAIEQKEITNKVITINHAPIKLSLDEPSGWHNKESFFHCFKDWLKGRSEKYTDKWSPKTFWHGVYRCLPTMDDPMYVKRQLFRFPPLSTLRADWKKKSTYWTYDDEEEEKKQEEAKEEDEEEQIQRELSQAIDAREPDGPEEL